MGNYAFIGNKEFICKECKLILKRPVELSCKCSLSNICMEHFLDEKLRKIKENVGQEIFYECDKCKTQVKLSLPNVKENNDLKAKIEEYLYLKPKIRKLKLLVDLKLNEMQARLEQINETKIREIQLKISDHFEALRNAIDVKRELVLEETIINNRNGQKLEDIHRLSADFIEKIELNEREFRQNFMRDFESLLNEIQIDHERKRIGNALRCTKLTKHKLKLIQIEILFKLSNFELKFDEICSKLEMKLKLNHFDEFSGQKLFLERREFLGKLFLNNFQSEFTRVRFKKLYPSGNYVGDLVDGKRWGQGKMFYINGDYFEGDFVNDKLSGKGKASYANGDSYEGDFEDGKFDGKGKCYWKIGGWYEGDFVKGKRQGKGKMLFANGNYCEGQFENDKLSGKGKMFYANGNSYEGDWIDGFKSGKGMYIWKNGNLYEGEFVNDKINGKGDMFFANGDSCEGNGIDEEIFSKRKMVDT